jgi:hypothetical protein
LHVGRRIRRRLIVLVRRSKLNAFAVTQRLEEASQSVAVLLPELVSGRIGRGVSVRQLREVLRDERQVSSARGAPEAKCTGVDVCGACRRYGSHEVREVARIVRDSREDRHDVDADVNAAVSEARDRAQACFWGRRSRLDEPRELAAERDERDVNRELGARGDFLQHIDVPSDERALRDDHDRQSRVLGERFEYATGDAKPTFGRLIGIGGGSDHDDLAASEGGEAGTAGP